MSGTTVKTWKRRNVCIHDLFCSKTRTYQNDSAAKFCQGICSFCFIMICVHKTPKSLFLWSNLKYSNTLSWVCIFFLNYPCSGTLMSIYQKSQGMTSSCWAKKEAFHVMVRATKQSGKSEKNIAFLIVLLQRRGKM